MLQRLSTASLGLATPTERKLFLNGSSEHPKPDSHWPAVGHMLTPELVKVTREGVPSLAKRVLISGALVEHGGLEREG